MLNETVKTVKIIHQTVQKLRVILLKLKYYDYSFLGDRILLKNSWNQRLQELLELYFDTLMKRFGDQCKTKDMDVHKMCALHDNSLSHITYVNVTQAVQMQYFRLAALQSIIGNKWPQFFHKT